MNHKSRENFRGEFEEDIRGEGLENFQARDPERLIHEPGGPRIELEVQNEEFRPGQEEFEEYRRKYADLFNLAPVGFFSLDSGNLITEVNLAGAGMFGVPRQQLIGRPFTLFVIPEDREIFYFHRSQVFLYGVQQSCELRVRGRDGEAVTVRLQSLAGASAAGDWRTAVIDIDELKKQEAARLEAEAKERAALEAIEREQAQRIESLRVLAGGISHDLNNLLVIINVNSELALKKAGDPELREIIEDIEHAARRIGTISMQMLTYSGGIDLHKEPLDLSGSVYETAHLLSATLSRKGNVKFGIAEGLPTIEADKSAIQQIVINLLLNAADAVEGYRGNILVSTGSVYADRQYLDRAHHGRELPQGRYEYLEVLDDGVGMTSETLEKIFEPFYTTKFTGRGMGLASVFGIVKEHGGAIEVESAPRKGTRVRVLLPQPDRPAVKPNEDETSREARTGSGTILLVDDEADVLNMTRKVLELNGYKVITADDGPGAIETFKRSGGEISAVVIDFIMPEMPGDETSRELRKISPDVPIVLLSGYHEIDAASMKQEFGITAVIKKPYRIDAFLKMLQEILEKGQG